MFQSRRKQWNKWKKVWLKKMFKHPTVLTTNLETDIEKNVKQESTDPAISAIWRWKKRKKTAAWHLAGHGNIVHQLWCYFHGHWKLEALGWPWDGNVFPTKIPNENSRWLCCDLNMFFFSKCFPSFFYKPCQALSCIFFTTGKSEVELPHL